MEILRTIGDKNIAKVYIAKLNEDEYIEFVESLTPPLNIKEKWVIIISTQLGCPFKCKFCDAGGSYKRNLKKEEIFEQINFLIKDRFPNGLIETKKLKVQFARIGEPTFNYEVLNVLRELPKTIENKNLIPSISTIAPANSLNFLKSLKKIKDDLYPKGNFQLQFSIHSTDEKKRNWISRAKKLSLEEISSFGEYFYKEGDKKITLNFALMEESDLEINRIKKIFSYKKFLIKITPVNPTISAKENKIPSLWFENEEKIKKISNKLRKENFDVIESLGELKENEIGSNCGQYIQKFLKNGHISNFSSYNFVKY